MAKEELEDRLERRAHPRYAVNLGVEIQVGADMFSGAMVDISIEGLRISLPNLIKPSADLVVTFSGEDEVKILAQAVWTLEKSTVGLPSYLVGLKISSVDVNGQKLEGMAERTAFLDRLLQ